MQTFKAVYINELYKISKKKKITVAIILSVLSIVSAAIIIYSLNNFAGIKVIGSSDFSLLVLSVLSYTLIPLFTAFVCIDMFSGEFNDQTIKLTLISPASRFKIFLGKVSAGGSFIIANLIFIMILSIIGSYFIKGMPINILKILLAYIVTFFPIFVLALTVIVIANIMKGTTSTFMLSILIFLLLNGLQIIFPNIKSFLFTSSFDWYRLFLGSYINYNKILRLAFILSGYSIMLFGTGYYLFEKKDI